VDVGCQTFDPLHDDDEVRGAVRFQVSENGGVDLAWAWAERNAVAEDMADEIRAWAEEHADRVWPELRTPR
jgi:hypothetical protein